MTTLAKKGKTMKQYFSVIGFLLLMAAGAPCALSQAAENNAHTPKNSKLLIHADSKSLDVNFLSKAFQFADWVPDAEQAQVDIQISKKKLEDGGVEYSLDFTGLKEFIGDNDRLTYRAGPGETQDAVKAGLSHSVKMGLMRYAGKLPLANRLSISFMDKVKPTSVIDKWDFWVFSLSLNTFLNGEKLYKSGMYFGAISANRVTPEWKIQTSLGGMYNDSKFTFDEDVIKSSSTSKYIRSLVVKSLNEHWSIGAYFGISTSSYANTKMSISPAPAVEYNFFPYSESTKRQFRLLYRLGFSSIWYNEETIYDKTRENVWKESLSATLELKQQWGTVSTSLEGSHYFHDFSKNRLIFNGELSLRLIKGLNFNIDASYSRIHDQLSLVRGGASLEEVLLRRQEIETTYRYFISIGLSYTFGSTRSNVVNPRFGSGGGNSISISF